MRRSEARAARAALKQVKDNEKSTRLRERPREEKAVRLGADPGSIFQSLMTWIDNHKDCEGAWDSGTPRQWSDADWNGIIAPKLAEWARLSWAEIDAFASGGDGRHKMHHAMDVDIILDEAQLRLIEIEKCEATIFRFRLGNRRRLWGFRRVAEFQLLWYDPLHEIYPTDPG